MKARSPRKPFNASGSGSGSSMFSPGMRGVTNPFTFVNGGDAASAHYEQMDVSAAVSPPPQQHNHHNRNNPASAAQINKSQNTFWKH